MLIKRSFEDAGYTMCDDLAAQALFNVADYGVPQNRERVIICAVLNEKMGKPKAKMLVNRFYSLMSTKKEPKKTVSEAIFDLPKLLPLPKVSGRSSHARSTDKVLNHTPRFHNQRDIDIFRLLATDLQSDNPQYLSIESLKQLYTKKTGKKTNVHKYYVLRPKEPSNTIPAHLKKDGLRHIHPDPKQARTITIREAARLQSFPDDFEFIGGQGACYEMIGNAVPPLFAFKISECVETILKELK